MAACGDLGFEIDVQSDVAPLNGLIRALMESGVDVHVLRDPTRGGLATSLNEIAMQSKVGILLTGVLSRSAQRSQRLARSLVSTRSM